MASIACFKAPRSSLQLVRHFVDPAGARPGYVEECRLPPHACHTHRIHHTPTHTFALTSTSTCVPDAWPHVLACRPLSDAERQLSADLDVAGAKKDALLATWRALERRARAAADARRAALQPDGPVPGQGQGLSSAMNAAASGTPMRGFGLRMGSVGGGGAGTPGGFSQGSIRKGFGLLGPSASPAAAASIGRAGFPGGAAVSVAPGGSVSQPQAPSLPPAQLARVHAAVVDQYKAISVCAAEVKVMEGELAAWAAKDVKQQVEKQLAQEDGAAALGSAAATSVAAITAGK